MANGGRETHRHFILEGVTETERYRSRGGGSSRPVIPQEDRPEHAARLRAGLSEVHAAASRLALEAEEPVEGIGVQVEFEGFPDLEFGFEKLPREAQGIELRNVRLQDSTTLATVFVPTGKLDHFEKLIQDYLGHKRNKNGHPIDKQKLLDTIRAIRAASVQALWTDDAEEMPEDGEVFWCEVWLAHPRNEDRDAAVGILRERARILGMWVVAGEVPLLPPVARPVLHDLDAPGGRGGRVEKAGDRPSSPTRSVPLEAGLARTPPKVSEISQIGCGLG